MQICLFYNLIYNLFILIDHSCLKTKYLYLIFSIHFIEIGEEIYINDDFSERLHCIIIEEENSVFAVRKSKSVSSRNLHS